MHDYLTGISFCSYIHNLEKEFVTKVDSVLFDRLLIKARFDFLSCIKQYDIQRMKQEFLALCDKLKPAFVFVGTGLSPESVYTEIFLELKKRGIVLWYDDDWYIDVGYGDYYKRLVFDIVTGRFEKYARFFTRYGIKYISLGAVCNPQPLSERKTEARDIPVSVVGAVTGAYAYRKQIIRYLLSKNIPIFFWGNGAHEIEGYKDGSPYGLHTDSRGFLEYPNTSFDVYYRSQIVLHFDTDRRLKGREFEAAMCGALLITMRRPEIYEYFEQDEIVTYSSVEEMASLAIYYLGHEKERLAIAEKGNKKALEKYHPTRLSEKFFTSLQHEIEQLKQHRLQAENRDIYLFGEYLKDITLLYLTGHPHRDIFVKDIIRNAKNITNVDPFKIMYYDDGDSLHEKWNILKNTVPWNPSEVWPRFLQYPCAFHGDFTLSLEVMFILNFLKITSIVKTGIDDSDTIFFLAGNKSYNVTAYGEQKGSLEKYRDCNIEIESGDMVKFFEKISESQSPDRNPMFFIDMTEKSFWQCIKEINLVSKCPCFCLCIEGFRILENPRFVFKVWEIEGVLSETANDVENIGLSTDQIKLILDAIRQQIESTKLKYLECSWQIIKHLLAHIQFPLYILIPRYSYYFNNLRGRVYILLNQPHGKNRLSELSNFFKIINVSS